MGRVLTSSDWHGCWKAAKKAIDFLQPDDTLYFLGDATDRGPDSAKILKWLLNDSRVQMIKGNHDQMLADYLPIVLNTDMIPNEWSENGGYETIISLGNYPKEIQLQYAEKLKKLPTELRYLSPAGHTIIMEHAGYTPGDLHYKFGHNELDALWDRGHFNDSWSNLSEYQNCYLIHGHTPVQYLRYTYGYKDAIPLTKEEITGDKYWWNICQFNKIKNKPTIIRYCGGHKFDIDMCTIVSNRIALLNLDTFEEIYFDAEDK